MAITSFICCQTWSILALPLDTQPLVTTTFNFMVTDGCTTPAALATSLSQSIFATCQLSIS
jgi:hypothetical protein